MAPDGVTDSARSTATATSGGIDGAETAAAAEAAAAAAADGELVVEAVVEEAAWGVWAAPEEERSDASAISAIAAAPSPSPVPSPVPSPAHFMTTPASLAALSPASTVLFGSMTTELPPLLPPLPPLPPLSPLPLVLLPPLPLLLPPPPLLLPPLLSADDASRNGCRIGSLATRVARRTATSASAGSATAVASSA